MTNLGYEVATFANSVVALQSWKLFHQFSKLENGLQFVNITSKKVNVSLLSERILFTSFFISAVLIADAR